MNITHHFAFPMEKSTVTTPITSNSLTPTFHTTIDGSYPYYTFGPRVPTGQEPQEFFNDVPEPPQALDTGEEVTTIAETAQDATLTGEEVAETAELSANPLLAANALLGSVLASGTNAAANLQLANARTQIMEQPSDFTSFELGKLSEYEANTKFNDDVRSALGVLGPLGQLIALATQKQTYFNPTVPSGVGDRPV